VRPAYSPAVSGAISTIEWQWHFLHRGWLEFWRLEIETAKPLEPSSAFAINDTVFPSARRLSSQVRGGEKDRLCIEKRICLEEMIRTGARRYDFLGGADPYKSKFGAHPGKLISTCSSPAPSMLARLYLQGAKAKNRGIKAWAEAHDSGRRGSCISGSYNISRT